VNEPRSLRKVIPSGVGVVAKDRSADYDDEVMSFELIRKGSDTAREDAAIERMSFRKAGTPFKRGSPNGTP
jgi:hypothetical protein